MSAHHLSIAARLTLPDGPKLVLLCLADDAGAQTGIAIPGLEELMAWCGRSRSKTLEALAWLKEHGHVEQVSTGHRGHRAEFRVLCPCPEHNGSRQRDPIAEIGSRNGSPERDPVGPEDGTKGPDRVPKLRDPLEPSSSSTTTGTQRGTRLPSGWCDQPFIDYALGLGFTRQVLDRMAEDFADYWTAQPGQRGVKLDWLATWRTWCRREADKRGVTPQAAQPQRKAPTPEEQRAARLAEQERQMALIRQMDGVQA